MPQIFKPFEIVGYADQLSVTSGDTLAIKVSTAIPGRYRADLVRVICGDVTPGGAGFEEEVLARPFADLHDGAPQPTNIGSYGIVDLPASFVPAPNFTLQAAIFPTLPEKGRQGLIGASSGHGPSGSALIIDAGELALIYTDEHGATRVARSGKKVLAWTWQLAAASYDASTRTLTFLLAPLDARAGAPFSAQLSLDAGIAHDQPASFAFAALRDRAPHGDAGLWMKEHFNGKLDRVRWSAAALSIAQILDLHAADAPPANAILGFWDFARDIDSARISDLGALALHGRIVNLPARAVTGCNWDGSEFNWTHAPAQYGAIFFHEGDLYDCGWRTDFSFTVPALRSGIYAVRLTFRGSTYRIPFFVRPSLGSAKAPAVFIAATSTYMAYANSTNAAELIYSATDDDRFLDEVYLTLRDHPEYGRSMYDTHPDSTGIRYSSRLRPLIDVQPGVTKMWSFNADTLITGWLERQGYAFDVITDEDLDHAGEDALRDYAVVITGSHPEYMSLRMRQAFDAHLGRSGRLIYMGGNGFFLRVAFSPNFPGAMEMRRTSSPVPGLWEEWPGEDHLGFTGERGGVWQKLHLTPHASVGIGFAGMLTCTSTHYAQTPAAASRRAAFVFEGIAGDIANDFGSVYGALVSDEFDRADISHGSPNHVLILATAEMQKPAFKHDRGLRADMIFFETPSGGAVFSTASISWGLGLHANGSANDVARVTGNVLKRFLNPAPFSMPDVE